MNVSVCVVVLFVCVTMATAERLWNPDGDKKILLAADTDMRGPTGPSIQKRQTESNKDGVRPSGNILEVAKSDLVDSPVPVRTFEGSEASEMKWPVGPSGNPAIARPSFAQRSEIRGPSGQSEIRGPSGQSEIRGPSGQSEIRGPSGQSGIRGPSGQSEIRGPSGRYEIRGPSGQSEIRGPSGSPAGRGEQGYEDEGGPAGPSGNPFGPGHPSWERDETGPSGKRGRSTGNRSERERQ